MPTPKSKAQNAAIAAKNAPNPQAGLQAAAAKGQSAADVASKDPDASPDDDAAHTLHGAKLLSAIANAHVSHLQQLKSKPVKAAPGSDD